MKIDLQHINKAFENRIRLGIMSILMVNPSIDFRELKESLQITDGNLASHISALEKAGYIKVSKKFIGKKPNTSYQITSEGRTAFEQHIQALEKLIQIRNAE